MPERLKFLKPVRNLTAAAVISLLPTSTAYAEDSRPDTFGETRIELQDVPQSMANDSILEQLDEMVETDYGKAFAYSLLFYSAVSALYNLRKGRELDSDRKFKENITASASLLAVSCSLVAQTETDVDPYITVSFLTVFSIASAAYTVESAYETDRRSLYKWSTSLAKASGLLAVNAIILANTIDRT